MKKDYKEYLYVALIMLFIFQLADAITTIVIMKKYGIETEASLVLRIAAYTFGMSGMALIKMIVAIMVGGIAYFMYWKREYSYTAIALPSVFVVLSVIAAANNVLRMNSIDPVPGKIFRPAIALILFLALFVIAIIAYIEASRKSNQKNTA